MEYAVASMDSHAKKARETLDSVLRDRKLSLSMKNMLGDPIETVIRLSKSNNNSFHHYISELHREKKINLLYQQFKGT